MWNSGAEDAIQALLTVIELFELTEDKFSSESKKMVWSRIGNYIIFFNTFVKFKELKEKMFLSDKKFKEIVLKTLYNYEIKYPSINFIRELEKEITEDEFQEWLYIALIKQLEVEYNGFNNAIKLIENFSLVEEKKNTLEFKNFIKNLILAQLEFNEKKGNYDNYNSDIEKIKKIEELSWISKDELQSVIIDIVLDFIEEGNISFALNCIEDFDISKEKLYSLKKWHRVSCNSIIDSLEDNDKYGLNKLFASSLIPNDLIYDAIIKSSLDVSAIKNFEEVLLDNGYKIDSIDIDNYISNILNSEQKDSSLIWALYKKKVIDQKWIDEHKTEIIKDLENRVIDIVKDDGAIEDITLIHKFGFDNDLDENFMNLELQDKLFDRMQNSGVLEIPEFVNNLPTLPGFSEKKQEILEQKKEEISKEIYDEFIENYDNKWWLHRDQILDNTVDLLKWEGYKEMIGLVRNILNNFSDEYNFGDVNKIDISKHQNAIILAEAVNWGSKNISKLFYSLKPAIIYAAWQAGAELGVVKNTPDGIDGEIYYLKGDGIGVASFHDPNKEIKKIHGDINEIHNTNIEIPNWTNGWSGVTRNGVRLLSALVKIESGEIDGKEKFYWMRKGIGTSIGKTLKEKADNYRESLKKKQ